MEVLTKQDLKEAIGGESNVVKDFAEFLQSKEGKTLLGMLEKRLSGEEETSTEIKNKPKSKKKKPKSKSESDDSDSSPEKSLTQAQSKEDMINMFVGQLENLPDDMTLKEFRGMIDENKEMIASSLEGMDFEME